MPCFKIHFIPGSIFYGWVWRFVSNPNTSYLITGMSPTEVFAGTPYFAVFCLAISSRIVWSALPNPYVRIITELLSSKFLSLIVSKINSVFSSEGAPSVRNKMTLFFFSPDSSKTEPFRRLKAFSNPILY